MTISSLDQIVEPLGWVLVHTLWQFTLLALLGALIQRTHLLSAAARANFLAALLFSCLLLPWTTWRGIPAPAAPVAGGSLPENQLVGLSIEAASSPLVLPSLSPPDVSSAQFQVIPHVGVGTPATPPEIPGVTPSFDLTANVRPWLPLLVGCWWAGMLIFSLRPLIGWRRVRTLRTQGLSPVPAHLTQRLAELSQRFGIPRAIQVWESALVEAPALVGYLRPMILLPMSLLTSFTAMELDAILAHELAHIRRRDVLVNILQVFAETVFFYHPGVWLLSGWIRREREHACDDLAAALLGDRVQYSRALVAAESLRPAPRQWALGFRDGSLTSRIERLLKTQEPVLPNGIVFFVGGVSILILLTAVLIVRGQTLDSRGVDALEESEETPVSLREVALQGDQISCMDALSELARQAGADLRLDEPALREVSFDINRVGGINIERQPLARALWLLVHAPRKPGTVGTGERFRRDKVGANVDFKVDDSGVFAQFIGKEVFITTSRAEVARQQAAFPPEMRGQTSLAIALKMTPEGNVREIRGIANLIKEADFIRLAQLAATDARWSHVKEITLTEASWPTEVDEFSPACVEALSSFTHLEKLSASHISSPGRSIGDELLLMARKLPSLQEIDIRNCDATDAGLKAIEHLPKLTSLSIDKQRVTDAGLTSIATIKSLRKLLLICQNRADAKEPGQITDAGMRQLAGLQSLRELDLTGLQVSAGHLVFPNLRSLSVGGPHIDDATIKKICQNSGLKSLTLLATNATPLGLGELSNLSSLESLTIVDHAFGDDVLKAVESLPRLRDLKCITTPVTKHGIGSISRMSSLRSLALDLSGDFVSFAEAIHGPLFPHVNIPKEADRFSATDLALSLPGLRVLSLSGRNVLEHLNWLEEKAAFQKLWSLSISMQSGERTAWKETLNRQRNLEAKLPETLILVSNLEREPLFPYWREPLYEFIESFPCVRGVHGQGLLPDGAPEYFVSLQVPPPPKLQVPLRERIVSLKAENMPLREVFAELSRQAGAELKLDESAFQAAGLDLGQAITLTEDQVPLEEMIRKIYLTLGIPSRTSLQLLWRTGKNSLRITTRDAENTRVDAALPPFLREFNQKGLLAEVDEEGFVQSVTANGVIKDDILARLPLLVHPGSKWSRLKSINFEVLEGITPEGLNHLAAFQELEVLQLYEVNAKGPGLGDAAIRVAAKLPKLRELSLNECGVTDAGMAGLEAVPWLTSLHLAKNGISDAGMVHLAKLTRLRVLDLNSIVRTAKYGSNSITDNGLRHLAGLGELEDLNLIGLGGTGKHLNFPRLQRLSVSGPGIDDAALENIAKSRDLRYLYLGHATAVTSRGMALIAGLPELRRVSLNGPVFSDESLALLKALPKLESVELTFPSLSDVGLKTLSEMKGLRRIDLRVGFGGYPGGAYESTSGTNITAAGLAQLKNLPELRELWLTDTRLATYQPLSEIKQLRSLTLFMCPITQLEFSQLEESLPNTQISATSGGGRLKSIRNPGGF